jgi:hypothetical protein
VNSEQKGERRRKRAWWLGALLGVVAVPFVGCLCTCLRPMWAPAWPELASHLNPSQSDFNPPATPFDQRKWQRGYSTDRIAMGKWLEANGTLIGKSREEVLAMLGEPEDGWEEDGGGHECRWHLGERPSPMFLSWIFTFVVEADHTGKVTKAWVYTHD